MGRLQPHLPARAPARHQIFRESPQVGSLFTHLTLQASPHLPLAQVQEHRPLSLAHFSFWARVASGLVQVIFCCWGTSCCACVDFGCCGLGQSLWPCATAIEYLDVCACRSPTRSTASPVICTLISTDLCVLPTCPAGPVCPDLRPAQRPHGSPTLLHNLQNAHTASHRPMVLAHVCVVNAFNSCQHPPAGPKPRDWLLCALC